MSIKINVSLFLHQYTNGLEVVEVNGSTVGQCLDHLVKQFPGIKQWLFDNNGKLHSYITLYVNGKSTYPEELAKPVKSGDELNILFMVDGG
jgi:adenylyltransferase/sulfurtransferase